jgi:methylisocitrate lyase
MGLDEAIRRATLYAEAGADATFVDAPESIAELVQIAKQIPGLKVVNMSETGKTPILSAEELGDMGFKIVLFPTSGLRVAAAALKSFFIDLQANGDSRPWIKSMSSLAELNDLMGLRTIEAFEREVLGEDSEL